MENTQEKLGDFIITRNNGIGEITEIVDMQDRGEFFKVSFDKNQVTNFFSVDNMNNYRFLATKENINEAVKIFNRDPELMSFESNKDKINFFKKELQGCGVKNLAKYLSFLNSEDEIHTSLKSIFEKALDSFVKEIEFVLQIRNIDAWNLLGLNKNNKA